MFENVQTPIKLPKKTFDPSIFIDCFSSQEKRLSANPRRFNLDDIRLFTPIKNEEKINLLTPVKNFENLKNRELGSTLPNFKQEQPFDVPFKNQETANIFYS